MLDGRTAYEADSGRSSESGVQQDLWQRFGRTMLAGVRQGLAEGLLDGTLPGAA